MNPLKLRHLLRYALLLALPASVALAEIPMEDVRLNAELSRILHDLDCEQMQRLTRSPVQTEAHFVAVSARQIQRTLDGDALIILASRGPGADSALSVKRLLHVTGGHPGAVPITDGTAYALITTSAELPLVLEQARAPAGSGELSEATPAEPMSAAHAAAAMNNWKGVRFIAELKHEASAADVTRLYVLPDAIRIDVNGQPQMSPAQLLADAASAAPPLLAAAMDASSPVTVPMAAGPMPGADTPPEAHQRQELKRLLEENAVRQQAAQQRIDQDNAENIRQQEQRMAEERLAHAAAVAQ